MGCYPLSNNNESNNYHNNDDNDNNPKMPFIKKWVRTRHAILFRLSNRTVQVLFFDRRYVHQKRKFFIYKSDQKTSLSTFINAFLVLSFLSFFFYSEVLLSSEARMVTYVDKQNIRSEHTLEDVLQTGRRMFWRTFFALSISLLFKMKNYLRFSSICIFVHQCYLLLI